ncbi:hypothetical protein FRACA_430006 [Frankia canadensis]|uniref:Uncharacterized protein n=1 Tax=Frankia canadensis TaxID=1836972 RepID=A0A2I2KX72_9ACTN|nr:hypothetical protein FRACA_430006 [Frankia canadensis]SOU57553.1 hypothetical protein FRACA_430006 [Frankia canadensis]
MVCPAPVGPCAGRRGRRCPVAGGLAITAREGAAAVSVPRGASRVRHGPHRGASTTCRPVFLR